MIDYRVEDNSVCHIGLNELKNTSMGEECCCICSSLIELFSHPWIDNNRCTHTTRIYCCIVEHNIELNNNGMISHHHGGCELFTERENKR
jgi:hypothetical protein